MTITTSGAAAPKWASFLIFAATISALISTAFLSRSPGRLLAACRHGKTLHAAPQARGGHLFAVASEPIGKTGWVEVPEDGFVGVDATLRVLSAPLHAPRRSRGPRW